MLDMDRPEAKNDIVWKACTPTGLVQENGAVVMEVPFQSYEKVVMEAAPESRYTSKRLIIRAYGSSMVRLTTCFGDMQPDDNSLMLQWDESLKQDKLQIKDLGDRWEITDDKGLTRAIVTGRGSEENGFQVTILPDGFKPVAFNPYDSFGPSIMDSIALGYVEREGAANRTFFSLKAEHGEKFAGTGERFRNMNLSGQTILFENDEATGVNSRRAYKNVPFYISSRPYGLFIHTSAHGRLSLADISTRAAQGLVEDELMDLFFIGGGSLERILYNYRRLTGFPSDVPLWSYGIWMSKLSYYSAEECKQIGRKLREEKFPCDVLHIDTGWFEKPWKCDWEFSTERYPDPPAFIKELRDMGFRLSLWQLPFVSRETKHYQFANEKKYVTASTDKETYGLFDLDNNLIDFSNPEALEWYKGMLKKLYDMGVAVIKTDFGETIKMKAEYKGMPARLLHNLYALIYQKTAFEAKQETNGEGIIWARAGWTGCHRYPVHWGGDSVCTWDGLAGTIKGGLHIGLSGFAFWSHDVGGFFGTPIFDQKPAEDLYVRWSQAAAFTSHMRYHGTSVREPFNYPEVADTVRKWFRLRYALIPYLVDQGKKAVSTGYPVFRAMVFHHENDPICWSISDQFYCGDNLLVAPVLNSEGVRDVYLPEGSWVDFWTGEVIEGPVYLRDVKSDLEHIPVYAVEGSTLRVYSREVNCTEDIDMDNCDEIVFDSKFRGIGNTVLGRLTGL